MMMKRSVHIPMLIKIEMANKAAGFRRTARRNSASGKIELQKIASQTSGAYVPVARNRN